MKVKKTIQMETVPLSAEQIERISLVMRCHQEIYNFLAPWACSHENLETVQTSGRCAIGSGSTGI